MAMLCTVGMSSLDINDTQTKKHIKRRKDVTNGTHMHHLFIIDIMSQFLSALDSVLRYYNRFYRQSIVQYIIKWLFKRLIRRLISLP